jgi:hypothetical protein
MQLILQFNILKTNRSYKKMGRAKKHKFLYGLPFLMLNRLLFDVEYIQRYRRLNYLRPAYLACVVGRVA